MRRSEDISSDIEENGIGLQLIEYMYGLIGKDGNL
jgi:hypothetical protein